MSLRTMLDNHIQRQSGLHRFKPDDFMLGLPMPGFAIHTDAQKGLITVLNKVLHQVPVLTCRIKACESVFTNISRKGLLKAVDLDGEIPQSRKKLRSQLQQIKTALRGYLEEADAFKKLLQVIVTEQEETYRFVFRVLMEAIKDPKELWNKLSELGNWIQAKA